MASKVKSNPLNSAHTAGIFSDMSVDGPEIGTLVLVVDRAKNLPNRKTIGKQDPYCAARLAKEAKKTTTDIRGGQTPRWDQELRFTVHDCPDYYQLKVSVFNDDKKTDLIGETWIDLRDIIVSGGGQSDDWHGLSCRGKYAGDIRIEITYYDSRPKPEKPAAQAKTGTPAPGQDGQQRAVKRRPLPSDPVTGQAPPSAVPEHVQTPPRAQPNPPAAYVPNRSPLQSVEYNAPPPGRFQEQPEYFQPEHYQPGQPPNGNYGTPTPPQRQNDRYQMNGGEDYGYNQNYQNHQMERQEPRGGYNASPAPFEMPVVDDRLRFAPENDRPPPPPAHRSRTNSNNSHNMMHQSSYDVQQQKATPPMRHDVLRNEAHRYSVPSYPGQPTYRRHDTAPAASGVSPQQNGEGYHHPSPPRQHSYDSSFDGQQRSMQATVEDVPESPTPPTSLRSSTNRTQRYDDVDYSQAPAPLNLGGRNSASGHYSPSPLVTNQRAYEANGYATSPGPQSPRDYSQTSPGPSALAPYGSNNQAYTPHRNELDDTQMNGHYALPPIPSTLVPGVDPMIAQEISERIYDERWHDRKRSQPFATPPRGRALPDANGNYGPPQPDPHVFAVQSQESRPMTYSNGPSPPLVKPRAISPNAGPSPQQHHTIRRKSISPAPPPDRSSTTERRLSAVPFGPDSYDALNPSVASGKEPGGGKKEYGGGLRKNSGSGGNIGIDNPELLNGKIITHDGREVDPSDHLPMDTWAPEPEPRNSAKKSGAGSGGLGTPDSRSPFHSPAGAAAGALVTTTQPNSASGRRPLRIAAARPQSMAAAPPPAYILPDLNDPSTPPSASTASAGRNRLQKKTHRHTASHAALSSAASASGGLGSSPPPAHGSSPLAPIHHHDNNGGSGFTPPRGQLPRAGTWSSEYANENHAPAYGSSPGHRDAGRDYHHTSPGGGRGGGPAHHGGGGGSGQFSRSYNGPVPGAPPVPAKIPLPIMSGALLGPGGGGSSGGGGGGGDWTLEDEMRRIDIGTGRARRHGGY